MQGTSAKLERRWVALALFCGFALRIAWNAMRPNLGSVGEASRVALAFGAGRGLADAYRLGQGLTAHLLPVSPGFAGIIYRFAGGETLQAEIVLAAYSIFVALLTYLTLYCAFKRIGLPFSLRFSALCFGCLAPAYIGQEAVDFRIWEGGAATLLLSLITLFAARSLTDDQRPWWSDVVIGLSIGLCGFINPVVGLSAAAAFAVLTFSRRRFRQCLRCGLIAMGIFALVDAPWISRNFNSFRTFIPLRSNAGLELAVGTDPSSLSSSDRRQTFIDRLSLIHPSFGEAPYQAMRASGGEISYAAKLGNAAKAWIWNHPGEEAQLLLLHARQALLPQRWQFDVFARGLSPTLRWIIVDVASLLGIVGIFVGIFRGEVFYLFVGIFVASWTVLSAPFQPVMRYTYVVYPLFVFCSAGALSNFLDKRPAAGGLGAVLLPESRRLPEDAR